MTALMTIMLGPSEEVAVPVFSETLTVAAAVEGSISALNLEVIVYI